MNRDWFCETGEAVRPKSALSVSFYRSRFFSLVFSVSFYQSRLISLVVSVSLFALPASAAEPDCGALPGARKLESPRYVLSYRTKPAKLAVGQHFVVEVAVCPKGSEAAPEAVRVDGFMPEHNHGMNY